MYDEIKLNDTIILDMTTNNFESQNFVKKSLEITDKIMNKKTIPDKPEIEINNQKFFLATFNRRLLASTIDMLLISILIMPVSYILSKFGITDEMIKLQMKPELMLEDVTVATFLKMLYTSGLISYILLMQFIMIFLTGLYIIYFWCKKGATPGKMIFKCKVIDAITGKNITIKQGIIRFLSIPLSIIPLLIGLFMIDFTKKRQSLHDKIAGTIVVIRPKNTENTAS